MKEHKSFKLANRQYSIRSILSFSFALIIIIMSVNVLVLSLQYRNILNMLNSSYEKMYLITDYSDTLERVFYDITGYYDVEKTDRARIKTEYETNLNELQKIMKELNQNTSTSSRYILSDISNMLITIDEATNIYFQTVDNESLSAVYIRPQLNYILRNQEYLRNEINKLSNSILQDSQTYNIGFEKRRAALEVQVVISTGLLVLFCLAAAILSSRYLASPIKKLAFQMKNFNASDSERDKYYFEESDKHSIEVDSLVRSYNKMTDQIYALIDELTAKADIERQLHQQKVDNLEIKSLLRKTELHMLQMQINPHFLFNTLNSIHALSVMDNADDTAQMISRLSKILRYSLRELNQLVPISEELDNTINYIELQKMRFGRRIEFHINYDNNILNIPVPGMIIQPLIENSIMHAFNREGLKGNIWLSIQDEIDYVSISVRDDGLGIDEATIQSIVNDGSNNFEEANENMPDDKFSQNTVSISEKHQTDTHGIGLDNVIKRVRILYGPQAFRIKSTPDLGTTVVLKIGKKIESTNFSTEPN